MITCNEGGGRWYHDGGLTRRTKLLFILGKIIRHGTDVYVMADGGGDEDGYK